MVPRQILMETDVRTLTVWRPLQGIWYPLGSQEFLTTGYKNGSYAQAMGARGAQRLSNRSVATMMVISGQTMQCGGPPAGTWYILTSGSNFTAHFAVQWGQNWRCARAR